MSTFEAFLIECIPFLDQTLEECPNLTNKIQKYLLSEDRESLTAQLETVYKLILSKDPQWQPLPLTIGALLFGCFNSGPCSDTCGLNPLSTCHDTVIYVKSNKVIVESRVSETCYIHLDPNLPPVMPLLDLPYPNINLYQDGNLLSSPSVPVKDQVKWNFQPSSSVETIPSNVEAISKLVDSQILSPRGPQPLDTKVAAGLGIVLAIAYIGIGMLFFQK